MLQSIRAVDRAIDILLCFSRAEPVLSLTKIAGQVKMPKSTVHRHLATLESRHLINRDEATGLYHLGFRFIEMASLVIHDGDFQRWIQARLERLSAESGEMVDLAVLDGAQVVYIQVIESTQRVKIAAAVGQRLPAFCTASGKAFLAYLPGEAVDEILSEGLTKYTESTPSSLAGVREDLRITCERGFAMSEQEYEEDINAVAAPILDAEGYPLAVIAIAGPSYRLSGERMMKLGRLIRETAEDIAREGGLAALSAIVSKAVSRG